jgi:type II secretory ATPase GspE/PulE/Tfp pilus assembly ATPase PilB-like protein
MKSAAIDAGTRPLLTDALHKMRQGLTTPEEILRVIRTEHADHAGALNRLAP